MFCVASFFVSLQRQNNKEKLTKVENIVFEAEGYTDDVLAIDDTNGMKSTHILYLGDDLMDIDGEVIDIQITSTNPSRCTPVFDSMLGHRIKVSVEVCDALA